MKKLLFLLLACSLCSLLAAFVWADTLELKDGRLVEGQYMGGTQQTIRFQSDNKIVVYPVKDVLALTFSSTVSSLPGQPSSAPKIETAGPATPRPKPKELALNPGTQLSVSLLDTIDINQNKPEDWFTGVITKSVVVDDKVVIPKDTKVNGQVVMAQQDRVGATLVIELKELEMNRKIIPITTKPYIVQTKAETLIGTNSLKMIARPRTLQIPYRTIVNFELDQSLKFER
ncbi:hypothetical protein U27_04580 [Candidatus Vecturithrix granuli]|uniref:Uncharacterized protein n=1 Tax=Vecturithrix granuli TaxID=1499967 RepID=A0A081BZ58_VECG1|nr:hypothetical protein U27_04580 [Candidatus Vecturithrix granuli]